MTCVLDASVALKAALEDTEESLAGAARAIRPPLAERYGLAAPALLAWEVGNVVHAKSPSSFGETKEDRELVVHLVLRDISLKAPTDRSLEADGRISEEEGLSFYDAAYLGLAEREEGFLITEDQALLEAGRSRLSPDSCLDTADAFHRVQDGVL